MEVLLQKNPSVEEETREENIFTDVKYICKITPLIRESLQNGCDVAQLPNGDLIVSEVKTINTQYTWDPTKNRVFKLNQSQ